MKGDFSRATFDPKKHYAGVLMQQGRVQLDADWNEQQEIHQHGVETQTRDVIGTSGAPYANPGLGITVEADGKTLMIGKGRFYADGILCENERDVAYNQQPDLPVPPDPLAALTAATTTAGFVYVDVWHRHITALDDPLIREVALGGPDTTSRAKTVWQVKILPLALQSPGQVVRGDDVFPEWNSLVQPGTGALSARSQPAPTANNPCLIPPNAGYQRLENQLYRVEIHQGGDTSSGGKPTFKWSRENGTVVTAVEGVSGQAVTVHDVGRDDSRSFSSGDWVEIIDDVAELNGQPGQLLQISTADPAKRIITLKAAPAAVDLTRHPKLRRWDSAGDLPLTPPAGGNGWIALEAGIEVQFSGALFRTGDYWLIPARTVTGNIEWPFTNPQLAAGITHRFSRLAVLQRNSTDNTLTVIDCRRVFHPLTEQAPALHVRGINWINDDVVTVDQFIAAGLQIVLDGSPVASPQFVGDATIRVTMDAPSTAVAAPAGGQNPLTTLVVSGTVTLTANVLQWNSVLDQADISRWLPAPTAAGQRFLRVWVVVKGFAVWSTQGAKRLYLDGQALGQPGLRGDGTTPRVDLVFPSGGSKPASDFESWFYLGAAPLKPTLASVTLNPASVLAAGSVQGTVTLTAPAIKGGATVNLSSGNTKVASVPASIVIPQGQSQGTFTVTVPSAPDPTVPTVVITASLDGVNQTATLAMLLVSVTIAPPQVTLFMSAQQHFSATVTGAPDTSVTWSVLESAGGTIDANGLYTAPAAVGSYHLAATSHADPTKQAIASVAVAQQPVSVSVSPTNTGTSQGGSIQFTATVTGATNQAVAWSVSAVPPATIVGTIDQNGLYKAPLGFGFANRVRATSVADPTKFAEVQFTVHSQG
jgi:hypothetical protein